MMPTGTQTTMASLPTEIILDEILPILPAKSLMRFKCVSKSFNTLISSPQFIDLQLRQSLSSDANRLLILAGKDNSNLYSIDVDSPDSAAAIKIPLPRTLNMWVFGTVSIVGSFNGLLCIGLASKYVGVGVVDKFKHVIINPSTGVYRTIPYKDTPWLQTEGVFRVSFGFGFDDINHDYKIVRVSENAIQYHHYAGDEFWSRKVMVYSLMDNSWKLVEDVRGPTDSLQPNQNGVLVKNHLLHWVFWGLDNMYRIYCFDARSDRWANSVPLMDLFTDRMADFDEEDRDKVVWVVNLGILYGCLCLSTVTNLSRVVWIMKEYGVKDTWVKLFEISHFYFCGPYGFRRGSKHEFLVRKEGRPGLFWCDIRSETYGRTTEEIIGVPAFEEACFFKGSLVPIPGGRKI